MNVWNERKKTLAGMFVSGLFLSALLLASFFMQNDAFTVNLDHRHRAPSAAYLFGTDWLGRDMLARTIKGLGISFTVGLITALFSAIIALALSLLTIWSKWLDRFVTWLIDLFLSVPHLVLVIFISFAFGGGLKGVIIALVLTHWPSLTRVLRSEVMQVKSSVYVGVSRRLGKSRRWISMHHFLPHLLPQLFVGFLLTFPHAILHEAALTFLGLGLPAEQPAIGVILSESIQYLTTGMWWLAFFPGLSLLLMVAMFDLLGESIRKWLDPHHESKGQM